MATGVRFALAGSCPNTVSSILARVGASMSPTTTTRRLLRANVRDQNLARSSRRHALHGRRRAVRRPAVGMAGEGHRLPLVGGDAVGVARGVGEAGQDLAAHAVHRVRIEARLADRQRQQCGGLVAVLGQRLEAAVEGIARILEAHAHGDLLHALLELLGGEVAGALVEHARRGSWRGPPCPRDPARCRPRRRSAWRSSGTLCSSTSHAVMPPGLFTTCIFMASALLKERNSTAAATRRPASRPPCRRLRSSAVGSSHGPPFRTCRRPLIAAAFRSPVRRGSASR